MSVNRKIIVELYPVTKGVAPALQSVDNSVKTLSRSVQQQSERMQKAFTNFVKSVGQASRRLSAGLSLAMGAGVKVAADFEEQMRNVNAIAKQSERDFAKTTAAVLNLNREIGTAQSPRTMAAAMTDIAGAGFDAQDSLKILKEAATGADAGMTTAAIAADGLTTTLAAFGRSADESASVMDVMFKTVDIGKIQFDELASNIGKVATFANSAGVSMEELHAGISMLSVKGLSAEENVVALRGAIKGILDPAKEAKVLYDELGLSYGQTALKQKGLIRLLQEMEAATGGDTAQMSTLLGDVRGLNAALGILSNDGGKKALDFLNQMQNADGSKLAALDQQSRSLNFQMRRLAGVVESLVIQISGAFLPTIKSFVDTLAGWANALAALTTEQKEWIGQLVAAAAALSGLVGMLSGVVVYLAGMKTALGAIGITGFGGALKTLAGYFTALNPAILAVVAAVAAMAVAWNKNLGGIQDKVAEWSSDISEAMIEVTEFFGKAWTEVQAITEQVWGAIGPFVRAALSGLADFIAAQGALIVDLWSVSWELISGVVEIAWEAVKGIITVQLAAIRTALDVGAALLNGDWKTALDKLKDGTEEILSALVEMFAGILREIGELVVSAGGELYNAGRNLAQRLADGARQSLVDFKNAFAEALGFAVDQGNVFGEAADRQFKTAYQTILKHTQDFGKSFKSEVEQAFAPLQSLGNQIEEGLSGVGDALRNSAPGRALGRLTGLFSLGGGGGSGPGGGDGGGSGGSAAVKKGQFDRAEALAFIREFAKEGSNLSGLGGLDDKTVRALHEGIKNAMKEGVELLVTSTKRGGGGHHGSGEAVDLYAYGSGINDANMASVLQQIFSGTGFAAIIDELRQGVLNVTGGSGPHAHATTGVQQQFKGTDGKDAVLYVKGASAAADMAAKRYEEEQKKHQEHLEAKAEAEKAHQEYLLAAESEYNQQRAAAWQSFAEQQKAYQEGLISEDMFGEALLSYKVRISELDAAQQVAFDGMKQNLIDGALVAIDTATQQSEAIGTILEEEKARQAEFHQQKYDQRMAEYEHQVAMDQLTYEQKVIHLQQMLAQENLTIQQKRNLELQLHNLRKAHNQERIADEQNMVQQFGATFENFLVQTLSGQKSFSESLRSLWKSLLNTIITYIAKAIVKATILKAIMGSLSGGLGFFHGGGIVGLPGDNGLITAHTGGVITPGGLATFHSGGMVTPGGVFSGGALRPDEIVAKLQTGEAVLPRNLVNQLRGSGGRSTSNSTSVSIGNVTVNGDTDVNTMTRKLAWMNLAYSRGG